MTDITDDMVKQAKQACTTAPSIEDKDVLFSKDFFAGMGLGYAAGGAFNPAVRNIAGLIGGLGGVIYGTVDVLNMPDKVDADCVAGKLQMKSRKR